MAARRQSREEMAAKVHLSELGAMIRDKNDGRMRRFLFDLFTEARLLHTVTTDSPSQSAYADGWRGLGLSVLSKCLAAEPDALLLVMQAGGGVPGLTSSHQTEPTPPPDLEED